MGRPLDPFSGLSHPHGHGCWLVCEVALIQRKPTPPSFLSEERGERRVPDSLGGRPQGKLHHRSSLALALPFLSPNPLLFAPAPVHFVVCLSLAYPRSLPSPLAAPLAVPAARPHLLTSGRQAGGRNSLRLFVWTSHFPR